jgi:hypothetical protein
MTLGYNRLLYTREYVRGFATALRQARDDLHEMDARHRRELEELWHELDKARAEFAELRTLALLRDRANVEVFKLYRERDILRAERTERDWARPLH